MNIIYCRVNNSFDVEMAENSNGFDLAHEVDKQKSRCEAYAFSKGLKIDKYYFDYASAHDSNRTGMLEIKKNIRDIRNIIVTGYDRLFRDIKEMFNFINMLRDNNVSLHVVDKGSIVGYEFASEIMAMLQTIKTENNFKLN